MSAARAFEHENGEGENELENTSLVPLSPLQLLVQKLKHIVFPIQD
jgi:hypothetical protein